MKLEDQVTSLELSIKLKEIGIEQKSLFYWQHYDEHCHGIVYAPYCVVPNDYNRFKLYSAFTVSELGERLPKITTIKTEEEEKKIFSNFRFVAGRNLLFEEGHNIPNEYWTVNYICDTTNEFRNWLFDALLIKPIFDKNEANARAKMLIYLIENGLMEIKKDITIPLVNSPETK